MNTNSKEIKQFTKTYKKINSKLINYNINIFCVNSNEFCRDSTKDLEKWNNNSVQDHFQFNLFTLPLNTCCYNAILKFLVLIGLYQTLITQSALADGTVNQHAENDGQNATQQVQENNGGSFISTVKGYLQSGIECISGSSGDSTCVKKIFLILSLAGTFLSLIGAMFSLLYKFCSCFMCCRRSPRPRSKNQANNNNKQMELMQMQMQMQQQQMCNALMGAAMAKRDAVKNGNKKADMNKEDKKGEMYKGNKKHGNEKKKKKSRPGTKKPRGKNSKDKGLHIGYQKFNE
ncbi:hypothetical protein POVWA2_023840 [Plasmodium ovale wallikeri]|uniref:PIR Superfamily Protein n=2 Tax=Plasmodium ovale TaxID=36330 RepID=A0A1A8YUI1_PLAOA|nr:hypothetical protein POVWA1_023950 [Plasmodium ovale wallikeri]SBT35206.1 hypothetical protein POVWA2_023840 [Plasmodium ovale wallikeri]SBT73690.1 hypothetical protein POWCR01_000141500 [Plasmodium ovale]